jgi:hypothetical protein
MTLATPEAATSVEAIRSPVAESFEFAFDGAFSCDLGDVDHAAGLDGFGGQSADDPGRYEVAGADSHRSAASLSG